jgi:hypothetical protein
MVLGKKSTSLFQIDGNYKQQPYSVWLDEVTLNAY